MEWNNAFELPLLEKVLLENQSLATTAMLVLLSMLTLHPSATVEQGILFILYF